MKYNLQLTCTIDRVIDRVINQHPEAVHMCTFLAKSKQATFPISDDEYRALAPIIDRKVYQCCNVHIDDLLDPMFRNILKRDANYLANKFEITECSAVALKRKAQRALTRIQYVTAETLLTRFNAIETNPWLTKQIKKYFKGGN